MRMVDDWRKRKFYAAQPKLGCGGRHALAALQYSNFSVRLCHRRNRSGD